MMGSRCLSLVAVLVLILASGCGDSGGDGAYSRSFSAGDITFKVRCANASSLNVVHVQPSGLEIVNDEMQREADGTVTGAAIADLDGNGWPEIYVFVTSAGSGSYGSLVGYAVNNGKSMSDIHLPDLAESPKAAAGYMGHDVFAIEGNRLVRSFPVYRDGDPNAAPSGPTRRLAYELKPGEATWQLHPVGFSED